MAEVYGVTDKGFVLKRYDEILEEIQNDVSDVVGFDVSQNPQSLINAALLVPFADKIASLWETAQDEYYAKYPSTASGISLDNACQYGNVYREGNRKSEYIIHVTAVDGTEIPKGSLIASNTNPTVSLQCAATTQITRLKCHAIQIRTVTVREGAYQIQLNGKMYAYTSKTTDTAETVLRGLGNALKDVSGYTVTYDSKDENLTITDSLQTRENEVVLSTNLTTVFVTGCVPYLTSDYGEIILPEGSITEVVSNVTGLKSIINAVEPTLGQTQESDAQLRLSYVGKKYNSASAQAEAIESYILSDVENTKAVRVYENATDVEDSEGRPPHSIEVVVDGGNTDEIAKAILQKKSGGIYTFGEIRTSVLGKYGDTISIGFNRPEKVYVWVKVEITQGGVSVEAEYEEIIKSIILKTKELTIGDSFLSQSYIQPIYAALPGIKFCDIKVATGTETQKTGTYTAGNIDISQRQVIDLSAARIEVSLK